MGLGKIPSPDQTDGLCPTPFSSQQWPARCGGKVGTGTGVHWVKEAALATSSPFRSQVMTQLHFPFPHLPSGIAWSCRQYIERPGMPSWPPLRHQDHRWQPPLRSWHIPTPCHSCLLPGIQEALPASFSPNGVPCHVLLPDKVRSAGLSVCETPLPGFSHSVLTESTCCVPASGGTGMPGGSKGGGSQPGLGVPR